MSLGPRMPSSPGQCSSPSTRDPNGYSGASDVTVPAQTGPGALEGEGASPQFPSPLVGSRPAPSRRVLGNPLPPTSNHGPQKTHDSRSQHPARLTQFWFYPQSYNHNLYIYIYLYLYTFKLHSHVQNRCIAETTALLGVSQCRTNEVRSRWQLRPLQSQAETWLTWDETHYALSPRAGAAATGVGGHSEGLGPHVELRAATPALTGVRPGSSGGLFQVRRSAPGPRNLGPAAQKEGV